MNDDSEATSGDPPDFATSLTREQTQLLAAQRARWAAPGFAEAAQQRVEKASPALQAAGSRLQAQARQAVHARSATSRVLWLRRAAQTFSDALEPHSACRNKCSRCCYQPVHLSEAEARVIAKELDLRMELPAHRGQPNDAYTGQPCVFLRDEQCSIYAQRPLACRVLFNMDVDDLLCRIVPGVPVNVPYANVQQFHLLYLRAHLGSLPAAVDPQDLASHTQAAALRLRMADIRDFFPSGWQAPR